MKSIFNLFERLSADKISFLYHGILHDEFTEKIIDLIEKNISTNNDEVSIKNKISFLVAESFQNVLRHSEIDKDNGKNIRSLGVFILRNRNNLYYITSANLINNKDIDELKVKLSHVNELDKDKLKELYIEILNNTGFSAKGGAGLGLIQMANKSGNKIEYDFEKVNDNYSYFYFHLKIKTKLPDDKNISELLVSSEKELCSYMYSHDSYLAYKGNFSQDNVLILLKIIERNLQANPFEYTGIKAIIFTILTELLQNISKHAYQIKNKKEGIFMLETSLNKYIISTGNYIENTESEIIVKKLNLLNGLDKDALKTLYLNKIRNSEIDSEGNAGIGFIEIARDSSDKIEYNISVINEKYSFLTVSVKI